MGAVSAIYRCGPRYAPGSYLETKMGQKREHTPVIRYVDERREPIPTHHRSPQCSGRVIGIRRSVKLAAGPDESELRMTQRDKSKGRSWKDRRLSQAHGRRPEFFKTA